MITGGMWMMADDAKYTATRALVHKALALVEKQEKDDKRTFTGGIYYGMFPPLPDIPVEKHGKPCSLMFCGAFGADDAAQALMKEFVDRPVDFGAAPAPVPFGVFHQMLAGMFLNFPPFAPYWKACMCKEIPPADRTDAFVDLWASKMKPYMGPSLIGYEFSGGAKGKAHAEKINGGHDHCVTKLRDYLVNVVAMTYTPPDPAMFGEARALSRELCAIYDDIPQAGYGNLSSELVDSAEEKKYEDIAYSNMERVKAIKAKADPDNLFRRKFLRV